MYQSQSRTKRLLSSQDFTGGEIDRANRANENYTLIPDSELIALIERANRPQTVQKTASIHTWVAYGALSLLGISGMSCAVWGYLHPQVIEKPLIVAQPTQPERVNTNCLIFCR